MRMIVLTKIKQHRKDVNSTRTRSSLESVRCTWRFTTKFLTPRGAESSLAWGCHLGLFGALALRWQGRWAGSGFAPRAPTTHHYDTAQSTGGPRQGLRAEGKLRRPGFHGGSDPGARVPVGLRAGPGWRHRRDQVGSRLWTAVASGESGPPSAVNEPLRPVGRGGLAQEGQQPRPSRGVLEEGCRMRGRGRGVSVPTRTPLP